MTLDLTPVRSSQIDLATNFEKHEPHSCANGYHFKRNPTTPSTPFNPSVLPVASVFGPRLSDARQGDVVCPSARGDPNRPGSWGAANCKRMRETWEDTMMIFFWKNNNKCAFYYVLILLVNFLLLLQATTLMLLDQDTNELFSEAHRRTLKNLRLIPFT